MGARVYLLGPECAGTSVMAASDGMPIGRASTPSAPSQATMAKGTRTKAVGWLIGPEELRDAT